MSIIKNSSQIIAKENYNLHKLQLELLLLVNQELDLEKTIQDFLAGATQTLNCCSGHIWLVNKKGQLNTSPFSFPNAIVPKPIHLTNAIETLLLAYPKNNEILNELFYLPSTENFHNYFFPLGNKGIFLLQAELAHSAEELKNILEPVISKLTKICSFCLEYQFTEQKFNKIFEESPVSLWEQDLSATEAELIKLRSNGINDSNLREFLLEHPHLPLEFLKKLRVVNVNKATLDMYGAKNKEEFINRVEEIYDASDESREGLFRAGEAIISGKKEFSFECVNYTLDKRKLNVIIRSSICSTDSGFAHVFSSIQDITEHKQAAARYEYLATHDSLTELPNRRCYEKHLTQAIEHATKHNCMIALLYVDIDYFKKINDSYGHNIGDSLLRSFANKLRAHFPNEFVARLGGDEFAVIIKEICHPTTAGEIADNIKKHLDTVYQIDEHKIDVISSIGIAVYPIAGTDFVALNKSADIALYAVKNSGRNNYKYFTPEDKYFGLINLENELALAVEKRQIFLCYQPIYALHKSRIVGLEVLARWQHPKFGLIMPKVFISMAEDDGSIISMGYWIIEEACRQYMRWFENPNSKVRLKINVSPKQLSHRNFFATIITIIKKTKINPKNLEFELTETALVHQPELVAQVLKKIRSLGITLALDDIGMGYSSLSYLGKFPINTIKIDQSFVKSIPTNSRNLTIIKAILQMARNLKLKVIIEGVENRLQLDLLTELGCNYFQGYYFYKPLKTAEITAVLQREKII